MLTEEKLKIYKRYHGDIDSWARSGTKKEKSIIDDNDWYTIDGLLQDLYLINKGVASEGFASSLSNRLKENCINNEVIEEIRKLGTQTK